MAAISIPKVCEECNEAFAVRPWVAAKGGGRFCSVRCRCLSAGRVGRPKVQRGAIHHNYRHGIFVDARTNPVLNRFYQTVRRAIRTGKVQRPEDCPRCGSGKPEAHHTDYTQPLLIEWLCRPCHRAEHRKLIGVA